MSHDQRHMPPPGNHACPRQPRMPPQQPRMPPRQPRMPPGNHACPPAAMHAPPGSHAHAPPAAMHAPQQPRTPAQQPCMPPQQPRMPPGSHARPPATTHAPLPPVNVRAVHILPECILVNIVKTQTYQSSFIWYCKTYSFVSFKKNLNAAPELTFSEMECLPSFSNQPHLLNDEICSQWPNNVPI